jgi:hypothetical protein
MRPAHDRVESGFVGGQVHLERPDPASGDRSQRHTQGDAVGRTKRSRRSGVGQGDFVAAGADDCQEISGTQLRREYGQLGRAGLDPYQRG